MENNKPAYEDQRDLLTYGIRLYPVGETRLHEFLIDSAEGLAGRGGSCVCYHAVRLSAGEGLPQRGTLKEFYPADSADDAARSYHLARRGADRGDLARQLYAKASGVRQFFAARNAFFAAYRKLAALSVENRDLNRYLPAVQLYRGVASPEDPDNYTYYVWAPGDTHQVSFAAYLRRARKEILAGENCRLHLDLTLRAVRSLCRAVRLLHLRGLLHLDIKPENFGVDMDENGMIQPENISLFDVNSFFSADDPLAAVAGTPGFRAPELAAGNTEDIGLNCDIYSLGATLFYALAPTADGAAVYRDALFSRIDGIVAHSMLIAQCDENAGAEIADGLSRVLKKCLRREDGRPGAYNYSSVKYLLEDLDRLCEKTAFEHVKHNAVGADRVMRTDVIEKEDYWNGQIETGAAGAIQWLLYNMPLYDRAENGVADVLVLGGGIYAQKFIDQAFELAQVSDFRLRICVVSGNIAADKKRFLEGRPAFCGFFTVDGVLPPSESYGEIAFFGTGTPAGQTAPFRSEPRRGSNARLLSALPADRRFGCAFIALGDENLNCAVAADLQASPERFLPGAKLHYVCYRQQTAPQSAPAAGPELCPVNVNETLLRHPAYRQLRRMAFNAHLLWSGSLTALPAARAQFGSAYYFNSSLGIALAVKYKLHSIGVEMPRGDDFSPAARQTAAALDPALPQGRKRRDRLMYYEHRRWVVNRIAAGWQGLTDYSGLVSDTKDKKNLRHPCIVPCADRRALRGGSWDPLQHPRRWDETGDVRTLDPLDAASVLLHRHFLELSKGITGESVAADLHSLGRMAAGYPALHSAMRTFAGALRELLQARGAKRRAVFRSYQYALRSLKEALRREPGAGREFHARLALLEKTLFPLAEANRYTDLKANDAVLIDHLPFILTYHTAIRLCIPLETAPAGELIRNVAAALTLNPARVTYLAPADEEAAAAVSEALAYAAGIMDAHSLQTKITVVLLECAENGETPAARKTALRDLSQRITDVDAVYYEEACGPEDAVLRYLRSNVASRRRFTAFQRGDMPWGRLPAGETPVPQYVFSSKQGFFEGDAACRDFNYVPGSIRPCLTVEDLLRAGGAECRFRPPELLRDCAFFWDLYKTKGAAPGAQNRERVWQALCAALGEHAARSDVLARIPLDAAPGEEAAFLAPGFVRGAAEKLFSALAAPAPGVIKNWSIEDDSAGTVRLRFTASPACRAALERLFSDPYSLAVAEQLRVRPAGEAFAVLLDDLRVRDLPVSALDAPDPALAGRGEAVLRRVAAAGYLLNYKNENGRVSFCYASPRIKALLTEVERVLELYVYGSVLATGYFDEVRSGVEVYRPGQGEPAVMELVLIKGFRSMTVEVSARPDLQARFYRKLQALGVQLGEYNRCVLVTDSSEAPDAALAGVFDAAADNVETVNDPVRLHEIGEQLVRLFEA